MPTTKLKNTIYRLLLPFFAPSCGRHPVTGIRGHQLTDLPSFEKIIRGHHVLGSATLLESEKGISEIYTSSDAPAHFAEADIFFRVASITKTATATLIMRLTDEGALSPDLLISSFFPGVSGLEEIKLSHLLSHTSGIIDPPDLESALENGVPFPALFPSVRRFKPGSSFHYSNLGYGLIGCVLESALCEPVGEIFRKRLFEPLHMNATLEGCLLDRMKIMPVTRVLPYHRGKDLILTPLGSVPLLHPDPLRHYGHTAGSMYSDVSSLQSLLHVFSLSDHAFLSAESKSLMKSEHASYGRLSPTLSYGYGLLRISDKTISHSCILGHQGFAYGCADGAFWEEDTGRMIITLNGGCSEARSGRLGTANRDILRWAFRREFPSW